MKNSIIFLHFKKFYKICSFSSTKPFQLKSKRENLWKKHKRVKTEKEKETIESQIVEISKKITPLAEKIKHCTNIELRLERINYYYYDTASLKEVERTGWKYWNVSRDGRIESIPEHIYGTQQLAIAIFSEFNLDIDIFKVVTMLVYTRQRN